MDDERPDRPDVKAIGAILLLLVAGSFVALVFTGGQVSQILSNVGNSVTVGTPVDPPAEAPDPGGGESPGDSPAALRTEPLIVYTGTLELVVTDVDAAVESGARVVAAAGGYVGESQRLRDDDRPSASITYRIPAAAWDVTLSGLRTLADEVAAEQTSAVEVTGHIVDLEARLRNLRASEAALQGILEDATRIPDVLEVQRELTTVRGEIERIDAQRAELADQAAYGTLQVAYGVTVVAVAEVAKGWDAATEVDQATAQLVEVLQGLATAGIWLAIVWLPILLVLGVVVVLAILVLRRLGILRRPEPASA